jgi:hypothetical protein
MLILGHESYSLLIDWLVLCCFTPLSTIFQLYRYLQLPMQSVPITTDVVGSNLDQREVYNIMG